MRVTSYLKVFFTLFLCCLAWSVQAADLTIHQGATSRSIQFFVQDSSQTTITGLTGLTSGSAGLTAYYVKDGGGSAVSITLAAGTIGTYVNQGAAGTGGGFVEVSAANMPGEYQLSIPDAALSSGKWCVIYVKGATNMSPRRLQIELTQVDNQSAASFMTGVNGIAPPSNWNLMSINGSGRVDVGNWLGSAPDALSSGKVATDVKLWLASAPNALATGRVDASVGAYPGNTAQTGDNYARLGAPVGASISADIADVQTTSTSNSTSLSTLTTRIPGTVQPQTGDAYARLGAPSGASVSADILTLLGRIPGTVQPQTGDAYARLGANGAGLTALGDARLAYLTGDAFARLGAPSGLSISADIAGVLTSSSNNGTSLSTLLTRIPGTVQPQTGDAFARLGVAGAGLTALGDTRLGFLTGDAFARLGAPVGASISADIAAKPTSAQIVSALLTTTINGHTFQDVVAAIEAYHVGNITSISKSVPAKTITITYVDGAVTYTSTQNFSDSALTIPTTKSISITGLP